MPGHRKLRATSTERQARQRQGWERQRQRQRQRRAGRQADRRTGSFSWVYEMFWGTGQGRNIASELHLFWRLVRSLFSLLSPLRPPTQCWKWCFDFLATSFDEHVRSDGGAFNIESGGQGGWRKVMQYFVLLLSFYIFCFGDVPTAWPKAV